MSTVLIKRGTKSSYNSLATKDGNTLYFILDTGEIFLGGTRMSVTDLSGYVVKETGKGLSTNDLTDALLQKINNWEDTNTTYTLTKSGSTITLKDGEGNVVSTITDSDTVYTHPSYATKDTGLYKVAVDSTGHVSSATAVTKSDITSLGIPAQDTTYSAATSTSDGLMSKSDKAKLDSIASEANKYTHPSHTAKTSNLYKVTVDALGHVSNAVAVTKEDITALGIPGQDTNTTYSEATTSASGLMSKSDKAKLDGIESGANKYSLPTASSSTLGGVKVGSGLTITSGVLSVNAQSWDTITGKPSTFTPATHSHDLGEVSDTSSYVRMTPAERTKLSGIATGAEVNQNAFAKVTVGSTTIEADAKQDTLTLAAGSNVTITPDATNDKITISATDTVYTHPTHTAKSNGLYKITVDGSGHVSSTADVTKSDITALGIPAQDTVYTHPTHTAKSSGFYKVTVDGSGHVTGATAVTKADLTGLGVPGQDTTYSAGSGLSLSGTVFSAKTGYTTNDKNYAVTTDANGNLYVSVPWTDTDTKYSHPTHTAKSSGFYKVTVDGLGHVSSVTEVTKADITALGIPGSDTNTTYSAGSGLVLDGTKFSVNTGYTTSGKNYKVQVDSTTGGLFVSVPWTDSDTTYSAGAGIALNGTTFSNSGVRSVGTGTANGTISVNTNGTTADVAVKGLGSAAYTASSAYATSGHVHTALTTLVGSDANKSARTIAAEEVAKVVASAPEDFDTLKEMSDWISTHETSASSMNTAIINAQSTADIHIAKTDNPHAVTKSQVGLGNVENKSSATIRGELTKDNVTTALGYTPPTTNTTYSQATSSTLGLVKIGYSENGKNYPVELNSSGQMYVNVPWTDTNTNTTYTAGLGIKLDGTKFSAHLYDDTSIGIFGRTSNLYPIGVDADGVLGVVVPWTDTKYTHPAYTAKSSGLYKVTVDATGHVSAATAVSKSDITALGIPAQDTTYSAATAYSSGLMSAAHFSKVEMIDSMREAIDGNTAEINNKADTGHTHNYAGSSSAGGAATSANKVNSNLAIKLNGGSTEGTNLFTFNGSAAKTVNITPSSIGAAPTSHDHDSDQVYMTAGATSYEAGMSFTDWAAQTESDISGKAPTSHASTSTTYGVGSSTNYGHLKVGSNITVSSGTISLSKTNVTNALGYTPPTTDTTYSIATASTAGLVKPISVITKPTINTASTTSGKYYPVQMSSDGSMFVNVPWSDTNTTYTFNGAVSTIKDSNLTANRALVSDANGKVAVSAVTSTELGYLDGVTSAIQTQLDGKSASGHTHSSYVNQNAFSNITVGSTTIAADTTTDTLTLAAGSNITLTPDATNDKVTIAATNSAHAHTAGTGLTLTAGSGGTSGTTTYAANLNSTTSLGTIGTTSKLYAVGVDANGKLCVSVPWTDANTTYTAGTGLTLSGATFNANVSSTTQTVAANAVTATASRTYAVQVDSNDNLVVNVPWSDTGDTKVSATSTTTNSNYPLLFKYYTGTTTTAANVRFNTAITANPSTGTITATKFVGDGSGLTGISGGDPEWNTF